jgi:23S rRNA (uracil1939-C5)-methyltransferase
MQTEEIDITGLGAQGDGIAAADAGTRHVPFALPGERVAAGGDGLPRLLSAPSPERRQPVCRHFGVCGGCVAQHMSDRLYAGWKRDIVVGALRHRRLEPEVAPLLRVEPGSRRRAVLTARRQGGRIVLGYHRRKSAGLVDLEECPVLVEDLAAGLPALRAAAALIPAPEMRLSVLATPAGLDVAADTGGRRPDRGAIAELGRVASRHRIVRLSIDGEPVIERERPALRMGEVDVSVPPGAFVQAVQQSEDLMRGLVAAALFEGAGKPAGRPKLVADLFCGVGTFTFALARHARVTALDNDAAAIAALSAAARHAQGLKPIEARVRDLFREPLSPRELEPFDAAVFDPPRAGAQKQAFELARSKVATVVAVSCDPGTLARDLRLLADGGYAIASVTPIDQFVFSAHVEAVAVLRRPGFNRAQPSARRRRAAHPPAPFDTPGHLAGEDSQGAPGQLMSAR